MCQTCGGRGSTAEKKKNLEEETKYKLKIPNSSPEGSGDDFSLDGEEEDLDFGDEEGGDLDLGDEEGGDESSDKPFDDEPFDAGVEASEEDDPEKYIQQLSGKLGQSMRKHSDEIGEPDFDLEKFAINSVISASHSAEMDDNDQDDIIEKVKSSGRGEEESDMDDELDMSDEDLNMDGDEEEMDMDMGDGEEELDMGDEGGLDEDIEMSKNQERGRDLYNHSEFDEEEMSNCCGAKIVMGDICGDCGEHTEPYTGEEDSLVEMYDEFAPDSIAQAKTSGFEAYKMDRMTSDAIKYVGGEHIWNSMSDIEKDEVYTDIERNYHVNEEVTSRGQEHWALFGNIGEQIRKTKTIEDLTEAFKFLYSKIENEKAQDALVYFFNERKGEFEQTGFNISENKTPCWDGYEKVSGKKDYEDGSCKKKTTETINEAEYQGKTVELNKPMRGDVKKFKVYVKNDKGNVVKVNFGDKNMEIKRDNPESKKSFRARHKCSEKKDKTTAGYWSCKMWSKKSVSDILGEDLQISENISIFVKNKLREMTEPVTKPKEKETEVRPTPSRTKRTFEPIVQPNVVPKFGEDKEETTSEVE